ncbi:diaminopimelate decarboxylase [Gemella sp. zg-1178]|uniref:diaminopimelate decarboxylase n=1 Tax=Gemella sp. zg-1178 TaxID=2840372 RepID=UPI001C05BD3C|nr:diaminopimelate decarboxylase [Gemella sp. zg-1178]MBU0278061.1 diaminopimelate decarboxylase [Gemella sp. zg-1178]
MKLFNGMTVKNNELHVSDVSVTELKKNYRSPLYVYDENFIENTCEIFLKNFSSSKFNTKILYASKAFSCLEIYRIVSKLGLGLDVVSIGEIFTAKNASFDMSKLYFHGNNKTYRELEFAVENGVENIIIDNDYEHEIINDLAKKYNKKIDVLLRINTGIDAHTHEYIKTAKDDSKFGYSIYDDKIYSLIRDIANQSNLNFKGFHSHIGSQIFEKNSFFDAVKTVFEFSKSVEDKLNIFISVLNLGGGFGVYYSKEDNPFSLAEFLQEYILVIEEQQEIFGLKLESVIIEPGRSLICNAGSTLYTVGGTKKTYSGKEYIFVDGGMGDNPRYALYKAKYECCLANKVNDKCGNLYTVAGKYCESGDILINEIKLPKAEKDDLLLVSSTGAYNYSMASNYNRITKLPVVFVKNGKHRLVVKGESLEDLIKNDI